MIQFSFESITDADSIFLEFSGTIAAINYIVFSVGQPIKTNQYAFFTIDFAKYIAERDM